MADTTNLTGAAAAVAAIEPKNGTATETPDAAAAQTPKDEREEAFMRRERQLNKERQAIKAERDSWTAKQKAYETDYVPKSRLTQDPLSVLSEHGITYDKLTEMLLSSPNPNDPVMKAVTAKLKAIEDKQTAFDQRAQEAAQSQYDSALKQINTEVKMMVDSDAEYSTIKQSGMQDAVTELIKLTFEKDGYLMNVEDAAKEVENHLVEEYYKLAQTPKVQSRLKPAEVTPPAQTPQKQPQVTPTGIKTLTNTMTQNTPKRSSEKERIARAMAAFHGQNKG